MIEELSEFYIEKAKNDLGETESRKEQSIRQFKEWLSKHPFIKYPEIDDKMIIKFLRARKYSMSKAFETFEGNLIFARSMTLLTNLTLVEEARAIDIYKRGAYCTMKNRDKTGARLVLTRFKVFEDLQVSHDDFIRVHSAFAAALENEVKNQISGIKVILDFRGVSLNLMKILPLKEVFETASNFHIFPLKVKNVFYIGLPTFAVTVFNSLKNVLKEKIQERFHCLNDEKELLQFFEPEILLEEFGGNLNVDECLEDFYETFLNGIKYCKEINFKFEFNEKKFKELRRKNDSNSEENVGSFRKLEID